ncbi:MAG: transglycosylase domain-containing protein [Candidatus Nanopelagicales bacterium]|nr:transglycosylase domain-containing protein [Candidatus Nanopelagicales bacterium]
MIAVSGGLGVLAGMVVAAGAMPATSAVVASVGRATNMWERIPDEAPSPVLPGRTKIVNSRGKVIAEVFTVNRIPVPAEAQSPWLRSAVVATEDASYFDHRGVDPRGIARALVATSSGGGTQGGSTITQQYVKNLRVTQAVVDGGGAAEAAEVAAATEGSLARKLVEAKMALKLERSRSKDEILTGYLNVSYFGRGAFGAQAAAQRYFSRNASDLSIEQAALLAGMLQAPTRYDPISNPDLALRRRSQVIERMTATGVLDDARAAAANAAPLGIDPSSPMQGCRAAKRIWGHVCDAAINELRRAKWLGVDGRRLVATGGTTVRLTVDPKAQAEVEAAAARTVPKDHRLANAVAVVEPGTGRVLSMATNRDFGIGRGRTEIPLATTPSFSPASTFKVFTLTAALEAGIPLSTRLPAGSVHYSSIFDNPVGGYRNAEGLAGSNVTIPQATERSLNTAYVQLQEKVGVAAVASAARRLGIKSIPAPGKKRSPGKREGSFTLGARDVSVMDMAGAYAALAAHGRWCQPHLVDSVTLPDGRIVNRPDSDCRQAVEPAVADTVANVLGGVISRGTGRSAALPNGRPAAGKTGTSENVGAAWFAGFTPQAAAAVWTGDPKSPNIPMRDELGVATVYGGTLPADLWREAMIVHHRDQPIVPLPDVDLTYLLGLGAVDPDALVVPDVVGLAPEVATSRLAAAGLKVEIRPTSAEAWISPGTVVGQQPKAGALARRGGQVRLNVAQ